MKGIGVIGTGLIGGSFCMALKYAHVDCPIWCYSNRPTDWERTTGMVDHVAQSIPELVSEVDFILIATPVMAVLDVLHDILPHWHEQLVVSDASSTKQMLVERIPSLIGAKSAFFVPAHPIAGAEKNGPDAARFDLFLNRRVILTPFAHQSPYAIQQVQQLWECCGATVEQMSAVTHDQIYAQLSHLPHLLSCAYLHGVAKENPPWALAGTGFQDFTRIAAGNPLVWKDIFRSNASALLAQLALVEASIQEIRFLIAQDEAESLEQWLQSCRQIALKSRRK